MAERFAKDFRQDAAMSSQPIPEKFRDTIIERADQLGLTSDDKVKAAGGPSSSTMTKLRRADPTTPRGDTFDRLDKALQWTGGSARRLWFTGVTPSVGAIPQDSGQEGAGPFLYKRPEGLTDEQWRAVELRGRAYLDGLIEGASHER
jgi:hypothetical protein